MIRRFGLRRFLREGGAEQIHSDEYGTLFRVEDCEGDCVGVIVSDHISDSEFGASEILVPPKIVTAQEAVLWLAKRLR